MFIGLRKVGLFLIISECGMGAEWMVQGVRGVLYKHKDPDSGPTNQSLTRVKAVGVVVSIFCIHNTISLRMTWRVKRRESLRAHRQGTQENSRK